MNFEFFLPFGLFSTDSIDMKFFSPNTLSHNSFSCANSLSSIDMNITPSFLIGFLLFLVFCT